MGKDKVKISAELALAIETYREWNEFRDADVLESIRLMKESKFEYTSDELKILNDTSFNLIEEAIQNGYEVSYNLEDIKEAWKYKEPGDTPVKHINRKYNYQKMKKEVDFLKTLGYDELEVINCKKEGIEWKLKEIELVNKATVDELKKFMNRYFKESLSNEREEELNTDDLLDLYNLAKSLEQDEWCKEILEKLENRSV